MICHTFDFDLSFVQTVVVRACARREAMAGHVKDKDTLILYIRPHITV